MKPKPWEGRQWIEAEKKLFDLTQIDFDQAFVYGVDTALTLLLEALKRDYEEENPPEKSMQEKIEEAVQNITTNHRKIIDDWCKAYLAQLYEEGKDIKPGAFTLFEQQSKFNEPFYRKYWFEPKQIEDETARENPQ